MWLRLKGLGLALAALRLFMQERMHEARRRLLSGAGSVTEVATDLGYANVSHFAAAFRKRFGVNPASLK
ncbi:MAG: helix-turn-helix domain-containing protein [Rhodocyclaceae bacterium]|nr:helix-turn-helix domain-containing protein [Rhodocyclaceae bacterium]